jgi:hypothetical protein
MDHNAATILSCAFFVSALAGVAALLRSGAELTWLKVVSAVLNSGLIGLGVALLWYTQYQENLYFLLGVCVLIGLGGTPMVEFVLAMFKRGGLTIQVGKGEDAKSDKPG